METLEDLAVLCLEAGVVVREEAPALLVVCAIVESGELECTVADDEWLLLLETVVGCATEEAELAWAVTDEECTLLLGSVVGCATVGEAELE